MIGTEYNHGGLPTFGAVTIASREATRRRVEPPEGTRRAKGRAARPATAARDTVSGPGRCSRRRRGRNQTRSVSEGVEFDETTDRAQPDQPLQRSAGWRIRGDRGRNDRADCRGRCRNRLRWTRRSSGRVDRRGGNDRAEPQVERLDVERLIRHQRIGHPQGQVSTTTHASGSASVMASASAHGADGRPFVVFVLVAGDALHHLVVACGCGRNEDTVCRQRRCPDRSGRLA